DPTGPRSARAARCRRAATGACHPTPRRRCGWPRRKRSRWQQRPAEGRVRGRRGVPRRCGSRTFASDFDRGLGMRSMFQWRTSAFLAAAAFALLPRPSLGCVGDCNRDASVTIDELVRAVRIALVNASLDGCDAIDNDRNGMVAISELVLAVTKAADGCGVGPADEVLLNTVDADRLIEYDLGSSAATPLVSAPSALV